MVGALGDGGGAPEPPAEDLAPGNVRQTDVGGEGGGAVGDRHLADGAALLTIPESKLPGSPATKRISQPPTGARWERSASQRERASIGQPKSPRSARALAKPRIFEKFVRVAASQIFQPRGAS